MVDVKVGLKVLSCVVWKDVLCSYRKSVKSGLMGRCLKCREYERFMRDMDREDDEFWVWEEKVRKNPEAYQRGEL